jgi:hypothetical protein
MALPGTYNFNYYKGDTFDFIVNPKNPNGTAFNLTEYDSSLFAIATERGNPAALVAYASASIDASQSRIICKIPPSVGVQLSGTSYVYDIEIENISASTVYTFLTGTITVIQDVSRTGES